MTELIQQFRINLGIKWGSRCPNDGGLYYDAFEEIHWHRGRCPNCGKEVKW